MTKRLSLLLAVCAVVACGVLFLSARHASAAHSRAAASGSEVAGLLARALADKSGGGHGGVCAVGARGCALGCAILVAGHALGVPRGDSLCRSVPPERPCAIPISDAPSAGSARSGVGLCGRESLRSIDRNRGKRVRPRKR